MQVKDYILGQRRILRSPLSREEVYTRINRASVCILNPFGSGVKGWARFGRLRLRIQRSPFEYNAKPLLSGTIREVPGGTELSVRFGGPAWAIAFFCFWYIVLGLIGTFLIGAFIIGDEGLNREAFPGGMMVLSVLLIAPIIMHAVGTRQSAKEMEEMINFLGREVQTTVQSSCSLEGQAVIAISRHRSG